MFLRQKDRFQLIFDCIYYYRLLSLHPFIYVGSILLFIITIILICITLKNPSSNSGLWALLGVLIGFIIPFVLNVWNTSLEEDKRQKDVIFRLTEVLAQAHGLSLRYRNEHSQICGSDDYEDSFRRQIEEKLECGNKFIREAHQHTELFDEIISIAIGLGRINFPHPTWGNLTLENTFFIWKGQSPLYERIWGRNDDLLSEQGLITMINDAYFLLEEDWIHAKAKGLQDNTLDFRAGNFINKHLNFIRILEKRMATDILLYHFLMEYFYQKFPEEKLNLIYNVKTPYRKNLPQIPLVNRLLREDPNTLKRVNLICQYGLGRLSTMNTVPSLMIEGIPYD